MRVVDASVVLGWVLEQPEAVGAERIIEEHVDGREPLVAPELLQYEVANVIARGARLTEGEARELYRRFGALGVETYSLGESEYEAAVLLAVRRQLSVYDASYVVLARVLDCRMVTADRKLARAVAGLGVVDVV